MWEEPEPRGVRVARGAGRGEQDFLEEGVLKAESEEDGLHSKERDREVCLVSSVLLVPEMCGVGARGGGPLSLAELATAVADPWQGG